MYEQWSRPLYLPQYEASLLTYYASLCPHFQFRWKFKHFLRYDNQEIAALQPSSLLKKELKVLTGNVRLIVTSSHWWVTTSGEKQCNLKASRLRILHSGGSSQATYCKCMLNAQTSIQSL